MGPVQVQLWSDAATAQLTGKRPHFPEAERAYVLDAIRYVDRVALCERLDSATGMPINFNAPGATWAVDAASDHPDRMAWCQDRGLAYHVVPDSVLRQIPAPLLPDDKRTPHMKKVIVTGCYDWFHSGHVRFFEEVSQLGQLYVVVGHDHNIRLLKGKGHPMFPAEERGYIVGSIRHVHQALISTGNGWLDAEPEMERLRADIYAVNEDGDRPEKRAYCETHGIEYSVLKRTPKEGLPRRQSTDLRGF